MPKSITEQMAERIAEYIDQCNGKTLNEIYKLCFGEDGLTREYEASLEG